MANESLAQIIAVSVHPPYSSFGFEVVFVLKMEGRDDPVRVSFKYTRTKEFSWRSCFSMIGGSHRSLTSLNADKAAGQLMDEAERILSNYVPRVLTLVEDLAKDKEND